MAVFKLQLDDFDEVDYELFAIHTPLEDFRLAYFINQKLSVVLRKNKESISLRLKQTEVYFSVFTCIDFSNDSKWSLIQNKSEVIIHSNQSSQNLFKDIETEHTVHLLPELKKVDYFLKIENNIEGIEARKIIKEISAIKGVTLLYEVNPENIKSKNHLIF